MTLTESNYYDKATDWQYMSKTFYWQFLQCEAAGLAMLNDEYSPFKDDTALLFGNYLHSYFESEKSHESFIKANENKLYKRGNRDNGLLKKFEQAETCIKAMEDDAAFNDLYQGDKEVIVTGRIDGILWKGKIDCLNLERELFLDLKTVDDIDKKIWLPKSHSKENFVLARGYDTQMAIYQELIKQTFNVDCQPLILAVSKQDTPNKKTIAIPQGVLDASLDEVRQLQGRVHRVITGEEKPKACGKCDYCHSLSTFNDIYMINDF